MHCIASAVGNRAYQASSSARLETAPTGWGALINHAYQIGRAYRAENRLDDGHFIVSAVGNRAYWASSSARL